MVDNRAADPSPTARGLPLDCLAAGVEAARPARAVDRTCTVADGVLRVRDDAYDLAAAPVDRLEDRPTGVVLTTPAPRPRTA